MMQETSGQLKAEQNSAAAPNSVTYAAAKTRILFVSDTWQGSTGRSLREALACDERVLLNDIGRDHYLPNYQLLPLRIANRLLAGLQRRELAFALIRAVSDFKPHAVVLYKGTGVLRRTVEQIRRSGAVVVNVFPDYSPHAYGKHLQRSMGSYDLVISTKPFHPHLWRSVYGYSNPCVCVPHGYDPAVHLWHDPAPADQYDVVLCASYRPEYGRLMRAFARELSDESISVAVAGSGWGARKQDLPPHWRVSGPFMGSAYGDFVRSGRIVIAPVNREVIVRGVRQPGDEDTTRTYELASARCFFLHQRTGFVSTVYDDQKEVPLWSDAKELAALVRRWLPDAAGRLAMATRAHQRAVPAYSIQSRANEVLQQLEQLLGRRQHRAGDDRRDGKPS
jgi:spore maturation protein CgeB